MNLRLAKDKRCKELEELIDIESRKKKGLEQIKEALEKKVASLTEELNFKKEGLKKAKEELSHYVNTHQELQQRLDHA